MTFFNFSSFQNNVALKDQNERSVTYKELTTCVSEYSKELSNQNKQLAFILCENTIETVVGYLGCLSSKTVPLLIDATISPELFQSLFEEYEPTYIWGEINTAEQLLDNKNYSKTYAYQNNTLFKSKNTISPVLHEDLALLLTTSGSTGSQKLVRLSYKNLEANTTSIATYLNLTSADSAISTLPLNYSFGLSILNTHLQVGGTMFLTKDSILSPTFWNFLKASKPTSISGVPYTYDMLKKLRFTKMELPFIKTLTQAGGKLSKELVSFYAEYASETEKKLFIMYGQTEATARIAYLPPDQCLKNAGSIGGPIPGGTIHLNQPSDSPAKPNTEGEIVYSGENVMMGYAISKKDLNKGDELNGILYTGDIGYKDDNGFWHITGRKKRFIKIMGNRVNLDEVEKKLETLTEAEIMCLGKDDKLTILYTSTSIEPVIKETLQKLFKFHHSVYDMKKIADIPKNSSGKKQYTKVNITNHD